MVMNGSRVMVGSMFGSRIMAGSRSLGSWLEVESWNGHGWKHCWKQGHGWKQGDGRVKVTVGSRIMDGSWLEAGS